MIFTINSTFCKVKVAYYTGDSNADCKHAQRGGWNPSGQNIALKYAFKLHKSAPLLVN